VRVVREYPRRIREIEHTLIPLADGCRLAARIWLPEDAEDDPVPAILELLPYRKSDGTAIRDAERQPYLAGHGYACVRVDARGSGESDGVIEDEYTAREIDDAVEVLAWLAGQPWCTGATGMTGISWGGFNSLQVAAQRPPSLRAILTLCASDDRYADDVHYRGGCVLATDMLPWAASMQVFLARPPDPRLIGEGWREAWLERLQRTPPFVEHWLSHQRRDAYWRHGSVCEDYAAIECAVYAVGGWADGYTNAVLRLLAGLQGPRKGLIGPWSHMFPDHGEPGPTIGFLQESLRWWDHWLKGVDTGVMDEPMLRVFMQDSVRPRAHFAVRPGRWVAEDTWPSPRVSEHVLCLGAHGLAEASEPESALELEGAQTAGLEAGVWCSDGQPADLPGDQRPDDGLSLTFDSEPLAEPLEILGFPEVALSLASDRPLALVCVRLCDVAPDSVSGLVTRGLLNLAHRNGHEHLEPLVPGERYDVSVRLDAIAHSFPAGHRLRVAISPTYWPWAWPSPEPVTLTVFAGRRSRLALPVRPPQPGDAELHPFAEPEHSPPLEVEHVASGPGGRTVRRDLATGLVEQVFVWDLGGTQLLKAIGLESTDTSETVYSIVEGDPLSARVAFTGATGMARGDWRVRAEVQAEMRCDAHVLHVTSSLDAFEGDERIFSRRWTFAFPRDHV
jgi:putative CocE/NonD family hydrolase